MNIQLGALAPSLSTQLKDFKVSSKQVVQWQKISDAITLLFIKGIITEKAAHAARKKFVKNYLQPVLKSK
jgi:hypothetical protein